jgi:cytochrome c oxidase subunit 3/cytochrome o ubiquinol oxidase subunit 3
MMPAAAVATPRTDVEWSLPARGRVGMYGLIAAEAAIFTIFVVAYLFYVGKSLAGPLPNQVLHAPVVLTICLLASSLTVHLAVRALRSARTSVFMLWWAFTLALGAVFLGGTAREWHHLIYDEGLTVSTNLFGTTYYSLVGLHAFHVTAGVLGFATVLLLGIGGHVRREHTERLDVFSLYWHFVDAVWIVVFTVVYVIGR